MPSSEHQYYRGYLVLCISRRVCSEYDIDSSTDINVLKSSSESSISIETSDRLEIAVGDEWKIAIHLSEGNKGIQLLTPVETSDDWVLVIYQECGFYLFRFINNTDGESFDAFLKVRKSQTRDSLSLDKRMSSINDEELVKIIQGHLSDSSFHEYLERVESVWNQVDCNES